MAWEGGVMASVWAHNAGVRHIPMTLWTAPLTSTSDAV